MPRPGRARPSQDTDAKLEGSLNVFLAPVLLKAMSPDARVRGKVMEILGHINKVGGGGAGVVCVCVRVRVCMRARACVRACDRAGVLLLTLTRSLTRPLTHSLAHSLAHPPTHPLTHSPTHPLTQVSKSRPMLALPVAKLIDQFNDPKVILCCVRAVCVLCMSVPVCCVCAASVCCV